MKFSLFRHSVCAVLLLLAAHLVSNTTTAATLSPARYSGVIQSLSVGGPVDDRFSQLTPVNHTRSMTAPDGGSWTATIIASGGGIPQAISRGVVNNSPQLSKLGLANAAVAYEVQTVPIPGVTVPSGTLIPLIAHGNAFAEIMLTSIGGFAEAVVTISGPFSTIQEGASVNTNSGQHSNNFTRALVTRSGARIRVNLSARGLANGSWVAGADPIFEIDPNETFVLEGQTVRFTDVFELEFSPGLVPEPSTALLMLVAAVAFSSVRGRR